MFISSNCRDPIIENISRIRRYDYKRRPVHIGLDEATNIWLRASETEKLPGRPAGHSGLLYF